MFHIHHRIGIKSPIDTTYEAIATLKGISNWWTKNTDGLSETGKTITTRFLTPQGQQVGQMKIEVLALEPSKKVHWKFLDGPAEWIGTEVIFDLQVENDMTIVLFHHLNWSEEVEFKAHCSMKWAVFLLSLMQYVETGTGNPSPNDFKIDNWN